VPRLLVVVAATLASCAGRTVYHQPPGQPALSPQRLHSADGKFWSDETLDRSTVVTTDEVRNAAAQMHGFAQKMVPPDVQRPPYGVYLPREYNLAGNVYAGLFKVCVSSLGKVFSVRILRSTGQQVIDETWIAKVETWPYKPLVVNGTPAPFCHPLSLEVRSQP
jgi:hypothetical protein